MENPKKVYVVVSWEGGPSYTIDRVFSTRESAERFCPIPAGEKYLSDYSIEEFDLDCDNGERIMPTCKICMRAETGEIYYETPVNHYEISKVEGEGRACKDGPYKDGHVDILAFSTRSREHALELAQSKRAEKS